MTLSTRNATWLAVAIIALVVGGCAARNPGRLLVEYPQADDDDYAKIHPAPSVIDTRPKGALERYSQHVADEIEHANPRVACPDTAAYFQIKAVSELRENDLASADRDLKRAEDALRGGPCHIVQAPPPPMPPMVERRHREHVVRHRARRHIRRHRHCKCA